MNGGKLRKVEPMNPEGLVMIPQKPVEPVAEKVPERGEIPPINDNVGFFTLIMEWFITRIKNDILIFYNGGKMNNDLKATLTGVVTGLLAILSIFGLAIPAEYGSMIIALGVVVLGYFTNKKDKGE